MIMDFNIRKYSPGDLDSIVALSLRAWAPVFESIEATLPPTVYAHFYPNGWRDVQADDVSNVCRDAEAEVWVCELDGSATGFVAIKSDDDSGMGEIYMIAVEPEYQKRGIARRLTEFAVERLREVGMKVVMVETGADAGHGPARKTYESAGFSLWPVARYFKSIE